MTDVFNVTETADAVTVTIKYGASYEETWAVFKGASVGYVRMLVCEYFGVDPEAVVSLSTHELVVNMTQVAHGGANAAYVLGATVISPSQQLPEPVTTGNPWEGLGETPGPAQTASQPVAAPVQSDEELLIAAIAVAENVKALQILYKDNKDLFANEQVMDAYKARGKELTAK